MIPFQFVFRLLSANRLTILIFHRVLSTPDPLFPDEPDATRFDQIIGWVKSWFTVLPLDVAVTLLKSGKLPSRAVAITFDDGYADNYTTALPILKRHGVSATFFIATDFLDGGRMWNDSVIESIRLSDNPDIDVGHLQLGRLPTNTVSTKSQTIQKIIGRLKYLPQAERLEHSERFVRASRTPIPSDLMMTSEQVRQLHRAGMQIGAHTASHPILAKVASKVAYDEIKRSKEILQSLLNQPVTLFAYPNGQPGTDYLDDHPLLVKELGFSAAVSTVWGTAGRDSDIFQLPRFTPWDRTKLKFAMRLAANLRSAPLTD